MRWPVSVKAVLGWDSRVVLLRNDRGEWELPDGRLETAERPEDALVRELREELDVEASVGPLVHAESFEVVPGKWVLVLAYLCEAPEPARLTFSDEHDAVVAASTDGLDELALPSVYRRAIEAARPRSGDERPTSAGRRVLWP